MSNLALVVLSLVQQSIDGKGGVGRGSESTKPVRNSGSDGETWLGVKKTKQSLLPKFQRAFLMLARP